MTAFRLESRVTVVGDGTIEFVAVVQAWNHHGAILTDAVLSLCMGCVGIRYLTDRTGDDVDQTLVAVPICKQARGGINRSETQIVIFSVGRACDALNLVEGS